MTVRVRCIALLAVPALLLAGCANRNPASGDTPQALAAALASMSANVDGKEAERTAKCAYVTSARLKREYNVTGGAAWHNILVYAGSRKRGLCYHWTEDLLAALKPLQLKTLDVHWAIANRGTGQESNALVLTPKGEPLRSGIVLDPWRFAGRLFWKEAATDTQYPWEEDHSAYARTRLDAYAGRQLTAGSRQLPESDASDRSALPGVE